MDRGRWLRVWVGLLFLSAVGAVFSYTEARYVPFGEGGTRFTHLFFDAVPWALFAVAGFGFMLSSRTRRTGASLEGDRVLRHDGGFMLGHWTLALSCVVLLITGFGLGLFVVPRAIPQSMGTALLFNLHFVGALYFIFGFFYWVGNMIVKPKELKESLPSRESPREAMLHYAHLFGLTKRSVEAGKFHASERLAFPLAALTTLVIVVTGLFKVAARFVLMPEQFVYGMTFAHDLSTVVMLFFLLAHVALGSVVPWSWPLLRSALTGYVSREYAEKEHPAWMKELGEGQKHE